MDELMKELGRQLRRMEPRAARQAGRTHKSGILVRYSVRRADGGVPFVYEYRAPIGTWPSVAEHEAKAEIVRANLRPWVHLETVEEV